MAAPGFFRAAIVKDLRRRLADPAALAIWIGIPLALGGLMSLAFGGRQSTPPVAHVLLVDLDQSTLSRLLVQFAGGGRTQEFLRVEPVDEETGQRRIEAGHASALLTVPAGFQEAVIYDRPAVLTLRTNPAQRILPGIAEEAVDLLVQATFYVQQIFGDVLRQLAATMPAGAGPSNAQVTQISTLIHERLQRVSPVLLPPILAVDVAGEASAAPGGVNFGLLFLPGIVLMSVLFISQGIGGDLWQEEELGTLQRIRSSPQPMALWLGGKIVAGAVLIGAVATAAVLFAIVVFGIGIGRAPGAIAWATFAGAAMLTYFCLLQTAATSARGGNLLSAIVVFPLIMIGGSFFPFEAMPPWMASFGRWTPNGLAVVQLKALLMGTSDPRALALAAAAIGGPAVLAFLYGARRLERPLAST